MSEPATQIREAIANERERQHDEHEPRTPGTVALVLLLLVAFVVYYFANWKALADVWHVR